MESLRLATRLQGKSGNVIREILKLTQQSEVISFAGGLPSPDGFPRTALQRIANDVLESSGTGILQYATTEGSLALREAIVDLVAEQGIRATPDQVRILSGSQQGIDLAMKAFIDPGDAVLVQSPTYLAALQIISLYEGRAVPVAEDSEGMDPKALEEAIKRENPKIIYLIPTFRNPSGETMSAERRQTIVEIAARHDIIVLEDDPYGALRYSGDPVPAAKAFDTQGNVIYLGSFSKIIAPGLRVGYAIASEEVLRPITIGKQGSDVHTSNLSQAIVAEFLRRGLLSEHLANVLPQYKEKRDAMLRAFERHFPVETRWTRPDGGLFIWVELPEELDTTALLEEAVKHNVAYIPGVPFYADGAGRSTMRLNFSHASLEDIEVGIERLGRVITQALEKFSI